MKRSTFIILSAVLTFSASMGAQGETFGTSDVTAQFHILKCKKKKTATLFSIPSKLAHSMGMTSYHWHTDGGQVEDTHSIGHTQSNTSTISFDDSVAWFNNSPSDGAHMETIHWAYFCDGIFLMEWTHESEDFEACG